MVCEKKKMPVDGRKMCSKINSKLLKTNLTRFLSERLTRVCKTYKLIRLLLSECVYVFIKIRCAEDKKRKSENRVIRRCSCLQSSVACATASNPNRNEMSVENALKMSQRFIRNDSYYHRIDTRLNACSADRQMKSREKRIHSLCLRRMMRERREKCITENLNIVS